MPKGLAFLSKKSWHTSKLCNQEKVWIAEQQQKAEEVKIKELAKQIQQEREEEELNRISGKKPSRLDRGIDWMYQGGPKGDGKPTAYEEEQRMKEQEEYLLGKEFNPNNVKKGDLAVAESSVGVNMVLTRAAEHALDEQQIVEERSKRDDVQDWNSNFHLRHEDPMFLVEQKRKAEIEDRERKQRLMERVDRHVQRDRNFSGDGDPSDRSIHKDDRHVNRRRSSSSEYEDRRYRRKERKRSRRENKKSHRRRSNSPTSRRSRDDCHLDEMDRKKSRRDRYRRSHRTRSRSRSRSRSTDRRKHPDRSSSRESQTRRTVLSSSQDDKRNRNVADSRTSYGLLGTRSSVHVSTSDLGPDKALLAKKIQEKDHAKRRYAQRGASTTREYGKNGRRDIRAMTQEEREIAIQAMQADASNRSNSISSSQLQSNSELYEEEMKRRREGSGTSAKFLHDVARRSHGIDQRSEERL